MLTICLKIQRNLYIMDTVGTEKSVHYREVSAIKRFFIFPLIFFKAGPLEAEISLFSLILEAETKKTHAVITLTCIFSIRCFEKARNFYLFICG